MNNSFFVSLSINSITLLMHITCGWRHAPYSIFNKRGQNQTQQTKPCLCVYQNTAAYGCAVTVLSHQRWGQTFSWTGIKFCYYYIPCLVEMECFWGGTKVLSWTCASNWIAARMSQGLFFLWIFALFLPKVFFIILLALNNFQYDCKTSG